MPVIFGALSDGVLIAVVVFVGGLAATGSPIVLAHMTNKANLRSKQQDWDRQDEVAARAAAAAADVAKSQAAILAAAAITVQRLTAVEEQNTVIHGLVNSAYTASLEATRVALVGQREYLIRAAGATPGAEDADKLHRLDAQIAALEVTIADRLHAQRIAEAQIAQGTAAPAEDFAVDVDVAVPVYKNDERLLPPPSKEDDTP